METRNEKAKQYASKIAIGVTGLVAELGYKSGWDAATVIEREKAKVFAIAFGHWYSIQAPSIRNDKSIEEAYEIFITLYEQQILDEMLANSIDQSEDED